MGARGIAHVDQADKAREGEQLRGKSPASLSNQRAHVFQVREEANAAPLPPSTYSASLFNDVSNIETSPRPTSENANRNGECRKSSTKWTWPLVRGVPEHKVPVEWRTSL